MKAFRFDVNKHITREKLNFANENDIYFFQWIEGEILYCMCGEANN